MPRKDICPRCKLRGKRETDRYCRVCKDEIVSIEQSKVADFFVGQAV